MFFVRRREFVRNLGYVDPLSPTAWERLAAARNVTERGHRRAKNHHAQAPSVPIRRAGRRARDEARILPYALGGEKSPIGGICSPSVAPHLNRQFLREVRSEFSWTVDGAAGRSSGTLVTLTYTSVCSSCNFSFKQRKVYKPIPERGMKIVRRWKCVQKCGPPRTSVPTM